MNVIKEPNKILHQKLSQVNSITPALLSLIDEMKKTMIATKGVGLSANQVGKNLRIFIIDQNLAKENNTPEVYINPEMTGLSNKTQTVEEGCLSLPEYWPQIKRPAKIWIKAMDEKGNKIKFRARGFLARVLQHEIDHLNGILIKDKIKKE